MSDRCSLSITLRQDDLPKLLGLLGFSDQEIEQGVGGEVETQDNDDGSTTVRVQEADYGLDSERRELAAAGIPHYGEHSVGDTYDSAAFASAGRQWADVPISQTGDIMVPVDEAGVPDAAAAKEVRLYYRLLRKAERQIYGHERGKDATR